MTFDISWAQLVQFSLAIFLPLLVAIVTTKVTSGAARAILLAALTVATTVLTAVAAALAGGTVNLGEVLLTAIGSFVISVATYFGVWRANGTSGHSVSSYLIENVGRTKGRYEA